MSRRALQVRMTDADYSRLRAAAESRRLSLSGWARGVLLDAAERVLREAVRRVEAETGAGLVRVHRLTAAESVVWEVGDPDEAAELRERVDSELPAGAVVCDAGGARLWVVA